MQDDRYGRAIRSCSPEESKRARYRRDKQDFLARKEQRRKALIRATGRVPDAYQIPTYREEFTGKIREKKIRYATAQLYLHEQ